jgi:carbon-monoxide dehydrogenase small subunit
MKSGLTVNGERRSVDAHPLTPLIDVLRDELLLTGAKAVCREGFCGACTVLVDGEPTMSCLTPLAAVDGRAVVTIEGLADAGASDAVRQAFEDHDVVQCGMCFPGMVITMTAFLKQQPVAGREEVKSAMVGNACRCTGYERIVDALLSVVATPEVPA